MQSIFAVIARYLSIRNYFTHELREKLEAKGFEADEIEKALNKMVEMGYLDDAKTRQQFIQNKSRKGYGPKMIAWQLRDRLGENSQVLISNEEQVQEIQALIQKKYRKLDLSDPKARQKIMAALVRRGFSFEVIQKALCQKNIDYL